MQKLSLPILGAILACLPHAARADLYFGFGTEKEFIQSSAKGPDFDGGRFTAILRDGIAVVAPCAFNGDSSLHLPSLSCPLGTTGIISSGFIFLESDLASVDNEGQQADNTYWSLSAAIPAQAIEPFRPELCRLIAAPASQLQRPLDGFTELGAIVFYNLLGPLTREFDITRYELELPYGSLLDDNAVEAAEGSRMFKECVPGQYVFSFPALTRPDLPRNFVVRINPFLEAYSTSDPGGKQGFKFLGNRWDGSGYYQLDPRLVHTFKWQGIRNKLVAIDRLYFSLAGDSEDENLTDDVNPDYFPPNAARINIRNIQSTAFSLPPGFFEVGDTGVAKLEYERSLGNVTKDVSTRAFKTRVRFVDTYPGFAGFGGMFQSATKAKERAATADFDKDGLNNVTEFAMQSNPADATITSIASTATNFTVTALNHRATAGDTITITGASNVAYNGTWLVATATTDVLTVNSAINPGAAGKGGLVRLIEDAPITITAITPEPNPNILDLSFIPSYFTITAAGHGRKIGDLIVVDADVAAYDGVWTVAAVTANTIRVEQEGILLPATTGTVELFVADQLTVFDSEVIMPGSYSRTHAGSVIEITITKRPNVGNSISYGIETKADAAAKKWSKVKPGSTWTVTSEDETEIVFTSNGTVPLTTWIRPVATSNF